MVLKKKRSKRYRPKPVMHDTMSFVMSGMMPFREIRDRALMIMVKHRMSLEKLRTGLADKDDIDALTSVVNMSEALAIGGIGKEFLSDIQAAEDHLMDLASRGAARNMRFTMTSAQWTALKTIVDLHEQQLEASTVYDIELAYDRIVKRLKNGQIKLISTTGATA